MKLEQSRPNPARTSVEIGYELARRSQVSLELVNAMGEKVATIERGEREAGRHTVKLDVGSLASGVYHYRLLVDGRMLTRSLTVTR
jgi:hypothetical protein